MSEPEDGLSVTDFDILIVGAGPAGLACFHQLKYSDNTVLMVDKGLPLEKRHRYGDAVTEYSAQSNHRGAGGAGLFSDGKVSFFPSATEVWKLDDKVSSYVPHRKSRLRQAYRILQGLLGPDTPDFPTDDNFNSLSPAGGWQLKPYLSLYVGLADRRALVETLLGSARPTAQARFACEVTELALSSATLRFASGRQIPITFRRAVVATGRFGPRHLSLPMVWRRVEFGVRVEHDLAASSFPANLLDPKFMLETTDCQYRTFCCCRDGEVVRANTSGRTNFGLLVRVKEPVLGRKCLEEIVASNSAGSISPPLTLPGCWTAPFTPEALTKALGPECARLVSAGLSLLLRDFPLGSYFIHGPALEGVGFYPQLSSSLQTTEVRCPLTTNRPNRLLWPVTVLGSFVASQLPCLAGPT